MVTTSKLNCSLCRSENTLLVREIFERPEGETDFKISESDYQRSYFRCHDCGVYFADHNYDFEELYQGDYNASTYASEVRNTYDRIMSLPVGKSDNRIRCARVDKFLNRSEMEPKSSRILDVGSGLCVFLGGMMELGYRGVCVDPDPISTAHAKNIGVERAFTGSLEEIDSDETFELVTLNKVLEHVTNPVAMLMAATSHLTDDGVLYLELPDGLGATRENDLKDREEFFIEHYYAFDEASTRFLMESAGLKVEMIESIVEPSNKYTIIAFGTKL